MTNQIRNFLLSNFELELVRQLLGATILKAEYLLSGDETIKNVATGLVHILAYELRLTTSKRLVYCTWEEESDLNGYPFRLIFKPESSFPDCKQWTDLSNFSGWKSVIGFEIQSISLLEDTDRFIGDPRPPTNFPVGIELQFIPGKVQIASISASNLNLGFTDLSSQLKNFSLSGDDLAIVFSPLDLFSNFPDLRYRHLGP